MRGRKTLVQKAIKVLVERGVFRLSNDWTYKHGGVIWFWEGVAWTLRHGRFTGKQLDAVINTMSKRLQGGVHFDPSDADKIAKWLLEKHQIDIGMEPKGGDESIVRPNEEMAKAEEKADDADSDGTTIPDDWKVHNDKLNAAWLKKRSEKVEDEKSEIVKCEESLLGHLYKGIEYSRRTHLNTINLDEVEDQNRIRYYRQRLQFAVLASMEPTPNRHGKPTDSLEEAVEYLCKDTYKPEKAD